MLSGSCVFLGMLLAFTAGAAPVLAQSSAATLAIPRMAAPPDLGDFVTMRPTSPAAQAMAQVGGFITRQPSDGQPARQRTVAYLGYTGDALHVVYLAFDPEPARVRAHLLRRDEVFEVNDDIVEIRIDTFNDRRRSYYFVSNPLGVQLDAAWPEGGGQYDESFDAVWHSRGQRTDQGFVVLISIPFRSLRFSPDDEQTWAFYLGRWVGRSGEWSLWPAVSTKQQSYLAQMATLTGIRGVQTGRNMQMIPYANYRGFKVLDRPGNQAPRFVVDRLDPSVGGDAKIVLRDRFVVDVAMNPDFSQVESDAPQPAANQRFELFYPEKRPFFLENAGYFQTPINLVFTRRVADPSLGVKLTGKSGPWTIATLVANDESPGRRAPDGDLPGVSAWSGIARITRDLGAQSSLGGLATVRTLNGRRTGVASTDLRVRLSRTMVLTSQAAASSAVDGGSRGSAFQATLASSSRNLTWRTDIAVRSPQFRTDLGFVPRNDVREITQTMNYLWRRTGVVQSWGPTLTLSRTWAFDGAPLDRLVQPGVAINMARVMSVGASVAVAAQGFRAGEIRNLHEARAFTVNNWTANVGGQPFAWLSMSAAMTAGDEVNFSPAGSSAPSTLRAQRLNLSAGVRPSTSVRLETTYLRTELTDRRSVRAALSSHVLREKASWQLTREWSVRAIVQYDRTAADAGLIAIPARRTVNADVLLTRQINPWTALYLGFNTNAEGDRLRTDARQVFAKVSYLLRR